MKNSILLIGTGAMAIEYTKIIKALKCPIVVVGNSIESVKKYQSETKISATAGGIEKYLKNTPDLPAKAIVAVPENLLGKTTIALIKAGVKSILVEKPGGANIAEINKVSKTAKKHHAEVFVGYNRRQYESVKKAQEIIKQDGGVSSFNFEFTEWAHVITPLKKNPGVKENWFLHNSTHVVDLAFFLGGEPEKMSSLTSGKLSWHPNAAIFAGSGKTKKGALFTYQANWIAPGRWALEVLTKKHRLIFRPLEKLQVQNIGSVAIEEVKINDKYDQQFKPGLFLQVKYFIGGDKERLCSISEQVENSKIYHKILPTK